MSARPGLAMLAKTGHILNLEEPALFNETLARFLVLAQAGRGRRAMPAPSGGEPVNSANVYFEAHRGLKAGHLVTSEKCQGRTQPDQHETRLLPSYS